MLVDINWLSNIKRRLTEINNTELDKIVWVKDGKEVEIPEEDREFLQFSGLNNTDALDFTDFEQK